MKRLVVLLLIGLVLLATSMIFFFSLQDAPSSNQLSKSISQEVLPIIQEISSRFTEHPLTLSSFNHFFREFAHILEFYILGLCLMLVLTHVKMRVFRATCLTLFYGFLIAFIDEGIQYFFSPGRAFEWIDLGKDLIGIALSILTCLLFYASFLGLKKLFHVFF